MKNERFSFDLDYMETHKMGLDGTFQFRCKACGKCCKHRDDVLLTPYDLFRIARTLGRTPKEILNHYCECYIGHSSKLPVIRIKPVSPDNSCPFLRNRKCIVHNDKPLVCASFPLARVYQANSDCDAPFYVLQPGPLCGSSERTVTVRNWLGHLANEESERVGKLNGDLFASLAQEMHRNGAKQPPNVMNQLLNCLVQTLYLFYDTKKEFIPQYEHNAAITIALVDHFMGVNDAPEWLPLPADAGKAYYSRLLLLKAYRLYRLDWCKQRGFTLQEVDDETGAPDGSCFVCLSEFTDNEFEDEDYISSLLSESDFRLWKELIDDPQRSLYLSGEAMYEIVMKNLNSLSEESE